jgi:hypothetical protein
MIQRDPIEQALAEALGSARAPAPGDADMLRRLADRVVDASAGSAAIARPRLPSRVLGGAGGGLAVAIGVLVAMSHHAPATSAPVSVPIVTAPIEPARVEEPAPNVVPEAIAAPVESSRVATITPPKDPPTAAELYAHANEARRIGHDAEATSGYRTLQRVFPTSTEALASRMSLGRMLLDRRHDGAGALAEFDRYLESGSRGELREEALIGRARALGQLERREDERRAWKVLLREFPSSMYADQARERIATLGG